MAFLAALWPQPVAAQHIVTTAGRVLAGPNYLIRPGLGKQVGGNLFDSFSSFSLTARESATFKGPASVDNIIAGIGGGNPSTISGAIKSDIRGANLYLINPDGFVFAGQHAAVNVSGSFYAASADYLRLGRNARFAVTHPGGSRLSAANPTAFGFLTARPGKITVNGTPFASAPVPGTFGLIGGRVTVGGGASAQAAAIDLTAVAHKGAVAVVPRRTSAAAAKNFGRVTITGGSSLSAGNAAGGGVFIRARRLVIRTDSMVQTDGVGSGKGLISVVAGQLRLVDGSKLQSRSPGRGRADPIIVSAKSIRIDGRNTFASTTEIGSMTSGSGRAGRVVVAAGSLRILANGEISSTTFGNGHAGNVIVHVRHALLINGSKAAIDAAAMGTANAQETTRGRGHGGNIVVTAGRLTILDQGMIEAGTFDRGNSGNVDVRVAGRLSIDGLTANPGTGVSAQADVVTDTGINSQANMGSAGRAGSVKIAARRVSLAYGSVSSRTYDRRRAGNIVIDAGRLWIHSHGNILGSTLGSGRGGHIEVALSGDLDVNGAGGNGIFAQTHRHGHGGTVAVTAENISLRGDGEISAQTFGHGHGGSLFVQARQNLVIDAAAAPTQGQGLVTGIDANAGAPDLIPESLGGAHGGRYGHGGSVHVTAADITIENAGVITTRAFAKGAAGTIFLHAGRLTIGRGASIAASTSSQGKGGAVDVALAGDLVVNGAADQFGPTGIFATTERSGRGGRVQVFAGDLFVRNSGQITAQTHVDGNAGDVFVDARRRLLIDGPGSAVNANAGTVDADTGNAGSITVHAGTLSILDAGSIGATTSDQGTAGRIAAEARLIVLAGGGAITSTTGGAGGAGLVSVRATYGLLLDGAGVPGTGIIASATKNASGKAGSIMVRAPRIAIANAARISTSTKGTGAGGDIEVRANGALLLDGEGNPATQIAASARGSQSGQGGSVSVTAGNLTVTGGAEIASSTAGPGNGGNIAVTAGSQIALSGPGPQITARSSGTGDAGTVAVAAPDLLLSDGAAISTQARTANGGDITVSVGNLLSLADAGITTSVLGAAGNGGNITIASGLTLLDGGTIKAQAKGGNGGNITIDKDGGTYLQSVDSTVSASSQKGISGVVEINGITPLNGALLGLSTELRSAVALSADSCAARAGRPQSSLVAAGRGGLPPDPDATLPALYIAGRDLRLAPPALPSRADAGGELRSMQPAPARCG